MDYQNGKIYTLRSKETDLYYIGSTTQPLSKRMTEHRAVFKREGLGSKKTACKIMKYADAYIELLELFPCANKEELNKREGELQREFRTNIVNYKMEGRTEEEKKAYAEKWRSEHRVEKVVVVKTLEDLKAEKRAYNIKYNAEHKEKIAELQQLKYERNKVGTLEKAKGYYAENAERIKEQKKEYREKNKVQIAERRKAKKAAALI